jgi:hypothetical protein
MKLSNQQITKIKNIWDEYVSANKMVLDTKGNSFKNTDFNRKRNDAIEEIKKILHTFYSGEVDIASFKTQLDGYNKRNNLWGFPAAKGKMFFNPLTRANQENIHMLEEL